MSTQGRPARRPDQLTWDDLVGSLLWPFLLRAAGLALRPARLGLAAVLLTLITLVAKVPDLWLKGEKGPGEIIFGRGRDAVDSLREATLALDHLRAVESLRRLFIEIPAAAFKDAPWSTVAIAVPILLLWGIFGGGISRSAADEFSLHDRRPWTRSLAYGISKWHSFALVKLGPLIVLALGTAVLAGVGWLLGVKYLQVLPALFYPLALLLAIGCVVLFAAYLFSLPMLIPAVSCEGTDAIDASQRCFAYAFARPLKLGLYLAVLLLQLVVVSLVLGLILDAAVNACAWASTLLLDDNAASYLRDAAQRAPLPKDAPWSRQVAATLIAFWSALPHLVAAAFVISFWFSGGSILYLLMRQACDGQDLAELWTPGQPAGVQAPSIPEGGDADYE